MLSPDNYPNWIQYARLLLTFAVTVGLGIHAFYQHKQESVDAISPRKWMYWLYSVIFLFAAAGNFVQVLITSAFHSYSRSTFHFGYSSLLLTLSYVAILAGSRRRR